MSEFDLKDVLQIIATGGMILASTWRLSSQLTGVITRLDAHIKSDDEKFSSIEGALDTIAPRQPVYNRRKELV